VRALAIGLVGLLSLVGITTSAVATTGPTAELSGGNLFIGTTKVEAGARANGSFGSTVSAPAGYGPRTDPGAILGFRANPDECAWTDSGCPTVGDFFAPGIPNEAWGIQIGAGAPGYDSNATTDVAGAFETADGARARGVWSSSGAFGGAISVTQTYAIPSYAWTIDATVELTNTSGSTVNDVYYLRAIDPDNCRMETRALCDSNGNGVGDIAGTASGGLYTTHNAIVSQGSATSGALVTSRQTDASYLGLRATGAESRALVRTNGGFAKPSSIAALWAGSDPSYRSSLGSTFGDVAIYVVTRVPSIAPGATATVPIQYVLADIPAATDFSRAVSPSGALIDVRPLNAPGSVLRGICSGPTHGSLRIEGGRLRYVPAPGFSGTDTFSYSTGGPCGTVTITASAADANLIRPVARLAQPRRATLPGGRLRLVQRLRLNRSGRYTFIYMDPATGTRATQLRGSMLGARRLSKPCSAPILRSKKAARNVVLSSTFSKRLPSDLRKRMRLHVILRAPDGTISDVTPS
jgi:hypothetical protein